MRTTATQVAPKLWIGDAWTAGDAEWLKAQGITAVCNLTPDNFGSDEVVAHYYQVPINDSEPFDPTLLPAYFAQMEAWVDSDEVIYLHCHAGISRTPTFLIAWWMYRNGANREIDLKTMWSKYEDRIGKLRPIIHPHWILKRVVLEYFEGVPG